MIKQPIADRLELARRIAVAAGDKTLEYFRSSFDVERKGDNSPVTIADRQAEELLREAISEAFPDDAILGEEYGEKAGDSGYRWILDPIDGTKSFISGVPLYGTLVAVEHDQRSVLGVINIPALGEMVYAGREGGAWYEKRGEAPTAARVSTTASLKDGLFVTSQVDSFFARKAGDVWFALEKSAFITRTWGDCYGYLLVATGRAEAMVDPIVSLWDTAAVQPILEEAGGSFTDWKGSATLYSDEAIGTNGHVLEEVLAATRQAPPR